ncbi:MAG: hypothetical protein AAGE52_26590 [Myxococcota bacterium]
MAKPRFDLRFDRGRAMVCLGRPVPMPFGTVETLETELELSGAVQLTGGAWRFRQHRSRLRSITLSLRPAALVAFAENVRVDAVEGDVVTASFRDEIGVCTWTFQLFFHGADLCLRPRTAAFVRRGPVSPWTRLSRVMSRLSAEWRASLGVFRWARPLRQALAELLMPHGWRVPEERGLHLTVTKDAELRLESVDAAISPVPEPLDWVTDLEAGRHRWQDPRHFADGAAGRFEHAIESGVDAAPALSPPWLQAEAQERWVETFAGRLSSADFADSLLEALGQVPLDEHRWKRWVQELAEAGNATALRVARAAAGGPLPRVTRAWLLATAVDGVLDRADPAELAGLDNALVNAVNEAERLGPELPLVMAARAFLAHRLGNLEAAAAGWERAADHAEDPRLAAQWRRRAAELVLGMTGAQAAEPLFRRALADLEQAGVQAPTLVAQLATVIAARGGKEESSSLFSRLLRDPSTEDEAWRAAILAAARFHVESGEHDRARPFFLALGSGELDRALESGELSLPSLDFLDGEFEEVEDIDEVSPFPPYAPPTRISVTSEESPQVTLVAATDEEVRALLREARSAEEPAGLLDGALERAVVDRDAAGVRRVLRALDRLDPFPGEHLLRTRALQVLKDQGEEQ